MRKYKTLSTETGTLEKSSERIVYILFKETI